MRSFGESWRKARWVGTAFLAAVLLAGFAGIGTGLAAETPIPPAPSRWATDPTGWLGEGGRAALDRELEAYQRSTGHQILVWVGTTTGDTPTEDWTVKAFESWKIGRKGIDDGLAIFVFTEDRKIRIEVGYGLEGVVPDAIAKRVINEEIAPKLKAGDNAAAIRAGVAALERAIGGEASAGAGDAGAPSASAERGRGRAPPKLTIGQKILFGLVAIGFIVLLITNPSLAIWLLINILSGGRGGGGGGGGGGFSGGGGRSGGGGATGSW